MQTETQNTQSLQGLFIVIPVFNEVAALQSIEFVAQALRAKGAKLIVVDGGSHDASTELASRFADHVLETPKGRAKQMNAGARYVLEHYRNDIKYSPDVLLFLHVDTQLPKDFVRQYQCFLKAEQDWGFFPVSLDAQELVYRIIGRMISWRSAITKIATGDQVFMIKPDLWDTHSGFAELNLMEDLDWSYRCKKHGYRPWVGQRQAMTSARRWQQHGVIKTVILMWCLRFAFYCGVSDKRLANWYR